MLTNTPIILDLNGDGFKLTSADRGTAFDLNVNGKREHIAWTQAGSDDAFLVLDRNNDGKITDGTEVFGDQTPQPETWAPNGFLALKVFDANNDGLIDPKDPAYKKLRLWNDLDQNGKSAKHELSALDERGMKSITVNYKTSQRVDRFGNAFRYRAKVEGIKGQRFAFDVFLTTAADPNR